MRLAFFKNPVGFDSDAQYDFTAEGESPNVGEVIFFKENNVTTKYIVKDKLHTLNSAVTGSQYVVFTDYILVVPAG